MKRDSTIEAIKHAQHCKRWSTLRSIRNCPIKLSRQVLISTSYLKLQPLASLDNVWFCREKSALTSQKGIMKGQKRKLVSASVIVHFRGWTPLPTHLRRNRRYHFIAGGKFPTTGAVPWAIKELKWRNMSLWSGSNSTPMQLKSQFQQKNVLSTQAVNNLKDINPPLSLSL